MTDIKYSAESGITLIAVVIVVVVTHIKESSESCDVVEAVDVEERLEMLILQEGCGRTRVRSQQEMNDEKDEETGRRAQKEERLAGLVQVITSGFKGWGGMREKWRLYERKETQNYPPHLPPHAKLGMHRYTEPMYVSINNLVRRLLKTKTEDDDIETADFDKHVH